MSRAVTATFGVLLTLLLVVSVVSSDVFASSRPSGQGGPSSTGTRDYLVIYGEDVDLGATLRQEARRGTEIEDRFTSSVNGALLELDADAVERLRRDDRVQSLERDRWVRVEALSGADRDSRLVVPWGLDRINQRTLPLDGAVSSSRDGAGVEVYVIDTGIRLDHTEFEGRINPEGFSAYGSPEDCEGHGTHVAGTIAGSTYGVAPGASLTAVRVLGCNGSGLLSDIVAGIDWMISDHLTDADASGGGVVTNRRSEHHKAAAPKPQVTLAVDIDEDDSSDSLSKPFSSSRSHGTGSVRNLRYSGFGTRHEYRISATTSSSLCSDPWFCPWYPVAFAFPSGEQCRASSEGGTHAWVGYVERSHGTQTADESAYLRGPSPWRFCIYAWAEGTYHLLHETVLSPGQSDPDRPIDRPRNDMFADRHELNTLDAISGSSLHATAEIGEPDHHSSQAPRSSVWWSWTAPADGTLTLDTSGSSFDTVLAVYSGSSLSTLQRRVSDDDSGDGTASRVSLSVTAGERYPIAVDGYGGASGSVRLAGSFSGAQTPDPEPVDPDPEPVDPDPEPVDPDPEPPVEIEPVGPAVANLSLGSGYSAAVDAATERAIDAGITVVAAAGNSSDDACSFSPASNPGAITVGSTGITDRRSSFSNRGRCVDLFAPGENVISAGLRSPRSAVTMSGTSMAAPHVAGAAALLLGEDPSLDPAAVSSRINQDATPATVGGLDSRTPNRLLFVQGSDFRISAPSGDVVVDSSRTQATVFLAGPQEGSYQCSLNGADWQACRPGPIKYPNLPIGTHEFRVRSSTEGVEAREQVALWRHIPAAPVITAGPRRAKSRKATFRFEGIQGLRAECRLDRGAWRTCTSSRTYRGLRPGRHTFEVRQSTADITSPVSRWSWKVVSRTPRKATRLHP